MLDDFCSCQCCSRPDALLAARIFDIARTTSCACLNTACNPTYMSNVSALNNVETLEVMEALALCS